MRNYLRLIDWCALSTSALVLVICLWGASLLSSPDRPHNEQNAETSANYDAKNSAEVIVALFTIVLAISTIGLWVATKDIGRDANRIADRSAEHFRVSERAYVHLSHKPPGLDIDDSGFTSVRVEVKNSGRSPAQVTDVFLTYIWADGDRVPDLLPGDNSVDRDPVKAFLVAGGHIYHTVRFARLFDPLFSSAEDLQSKILVIYGYVDYIDKFGQRHRGGYARVYNPEADDRNQENRNNLLFPKQGEHNYDRTRRTGEGNDWNAEA